MRIFQLLKDLEPFNKKARLQKKLKSLKQQLKATKPYDTQYDKLSFEHDWYQMELNMMP